ncbi:MULTISPECIES: phospholipase D-like domain-containing protein [Burkholderia]|uniref:phospholipase D-like domain-containing protein n=1 Tax=Burkholderia TaxID=32008 RepID=UPI0008638A38|nr:MULTISPECIES: phospholipase D-like domain-containing protein [Burkholderia]AOL03135.1 hypothetical protein WI95_03860 [Burkholderia contaminans]MBN3816477.1 hypothetical protein [Paraburkholderia sp. Se-20369]TCW73124.1 hypothetical protein C5O79_04200 [Burkholderia sp. SRS-25]
MRARAFFDNIDNHIWIELAKAQSSLRVCVAWINWEKHSHVLSRLASRGVKVELMYNADASNSRYMTAPPGIACFPVRMPGQAIMHNKFCVIDEAVVITGSFNWSRTAPKHFENIVVIENDFRLVKSYLHEFEDLKKHYFDLPKLPYIQCDEPRGNTVCRRNAFHIGILGRETGIYAESEISLYSVCENLHVRLIGREFMQSLHTDIGLLREDHYDDDLDYSREKMLHDYEIERDIDRKMEGAFLGTFNKSAHAVGYVAMLNEGYNLKYGADPEWAISMLWRHPCYRKTIPDVYEDDHGIGEILLDRCGRTY